MAKVRIGIVGSGEAARRRLKLYSASPDAVVVAVAADDAGAAQALAQEAGCRAAESWEALAGSADVDAVVVAAPDTARFDRALAALENGKHVQVESPLCQTIEQAEALATVADAKRLVLHHSLLARAEPAYAAALGALGGVGEILCARFSFYVEDAPPAGNMFLALAMGPVDQSRGLFGEVKSLVATGRRANAEQGACAGAALAEHERCPSVAIEFGAGCRVRPASGFRVVGAEGVLVAESGEVRLLRPEGETTVGQSGGDPVKEDSDNFIARIARGAEPLRSWEDMDRTMERCLDCAHSAETGRKMTY